MPPTSVGRLAHGPPTEAPRRLPNYRAARGCLARRTRSLPRCGTSPANARGEDRCARARAVSLLDGRERRPLEQSRFLVSQCFGVAAPFWRGVAASSMDSLRRNRDLRGLSTLSPRRRRDLHGPGLIHVAAARGLRGLATSQPRRRRGLRGLATSQPRRRRGLHGLPAPRSNLRRRQGTRCQPPRVRHARLGTEKRQADR